VNNLYPVFSKTEANCGDFKRLNSRAVSVRPCGLAISANFDGHSL
jgi:hypothetical protein